MKRFNLYANGVLEEEDMKNGTNVIFKNNAPKFYKRETRSSDIDLKGAINPKQGKTNKTTPRHITVKNKQKTSPEN